MISVAGKEESPRVLSVIQINSLDRREQPGKHGAESYLRYVEIQKVLKEHSKIEWTSNYYFSQIDCMVSDLKKTIPTMIVINTHGEACTGNFNHDGETITPETFWKKIKPILQQERSSSPIYIVAVQCYGLWFAKQLQKIATDAPRDVIVHGLSTKYTWDSCSCKAEIIAQAIYSEMTMLISTICQREELSRIQK
mmetsp:Transcript_23047/g.32156  ORF Transcript_23047/g.32156 Transcript_23047/m.32156 type:complete len:195 (-) Transcript_23047:12-596(-)